MFIFQLKTLLTPTFTVHIHRIDCQKLIQSIIINSYFLDINNNLELEPYHLAKFTMIVNLIFLITSLYQIYKLSNQIK
jgi:hypothetical protein